MRLQAAIHDLHIHTWAEFGLAPADVRQLHVEHLEILQALKDRDPDKACDLMYRHVARTEEA
jgi:DNA-binding GntR family transcriptional regulator